MAKQKTQRIKAKVIDAVYVRGRGELCLHVEFPDSRRKTVSIHKDAFTCKHGDLDDEMEKTARMFIGKCVNIEMSEDEFEEGKMLNKIKPPPIKNDLWSLGC